MKANHNQHYWEERYQNQQTEWDLGRVSPPIQHYVDQLTNKYITVLIPGGGNSYEAEYLYTNGFESVFVADIALAPLQNLKKRCSAFPDHQLLHQNFFEINQTFDLIIEQTFFCALNPVLRPEYVQQCLKLLNPGGKLVGVLFDCIFSSAGPPFGGDRNEYRQYVEPYFDFIHFETCYNSVKPRLGRELFICLVKK